MTGLISFFRAVNFSTASWQSLAVIQVKPFLRITTTFQMKNYGNCSPVFSAALALSLPATIR
jgi:hypothetical protein